MKFKLAFCLCLFALSLMAIKADMTYQSPEEIADSYIPPVALDNYWWTYGGPLFTADISGTNEFDRGVAVELDIDLKNNGKITGLKQDKVANTPKEYVLADQEKKLETARTTAIALTGTLVSNISQMEIQSGDQVIQSLASGQKSGAPLPSVAALRLDEKPTRNSSIDADCKSNRKYVQKTAEDCLKSVKQKLIR